MMVTQERQVNVPDARDTISEKHLEVRRYESKVNQLTRHPQLPVCYNSGPPLPLSLVESLVERVAFEQAERDHERWYE